MRSLEVATKLLCKKVSNLEKIFESLNIPAQEVF